MFWFPSTVVLVSLSMFCLSPYIVSLVRFTYSGPRSVIHNHSTLNWILVSCCTSSHVLPVPGPVTGVAFWKVSDSEIIVNWREPEVTNVLILRYNVIVTLHSTGQRLYTQTWFQPWEDFQIWWLEHGSSKSSLKLSCFVTQSVLTHVLTHVFMRVLPRTSVNCFTYTRYAGCIQVTCNRTRLDNGDSQWQRG